MSFQVPTGHYLVMYDYTTGGLWWLVKAKSAEEIRDASNELIVIDSIPEWMTEEAWRRIEKEDLHRPKSEALRMILGRS